MQKTKIGFWLLKKNMGLCLYKSPDFHKKHGILDIVAFTDHSVWCVIDIDSTQNETSRMRLHEENVICNVR